MVAKVGLRERRLPGRELRAVVFRPGFARLAVLLCLISCAKPPQQEVGWDGDAAQSAGGSAGYSTPAVTPVPPPPPPLATPVPATNALEAVDRELGFLSSANIAFNSPERMQLQRTTLVHLLVSPALTVAELTPQVAGPGPVEGAAIRVGPVMEARLTGQNFAIVAVTKEEQAVGTLEPTEWKWDVTPAKAGVQMLHLTLTAVFKLEAQRVERTLRTFDKTIEVRVSVGQRLTTFVEGNWKWLWTAILVPIGLWVWRRIKKQPK